MYKSTRGKETVTASYAITHGISEDGGLYVKTAWPKALFLGVLPKLEYQEIAVEVLKYFLDDFNEDELRQIVSQTYSEDAFPEKIVGLDPLGDDYLLTLFHGPTFAFKDMALQMFSSLLKLAKIKSNETKKTIILSATSGDTGSAVLSGFAQDRETEIIIFYPEGKVSSFQEKQMHYFSNELRRTIAIQGNFDDCQNLIKQGFQEIELENAQFSSANSINIARIIPQVVYYFYAYKLLVERHKISFGDKIDFVVPTGNFGNILAGYYAKKMGLPIDKLVVASNDNHVLTEFFKEGIYDRRRKFIQTSSPSMDILISSNLERLLYELLDEKESAIRFFMSKLKEDGFYQLENLTHPVLSTFLSGWANEQTVLETVLATYTKYHVLVDPHTAVAIQVRNSLRNQMKSKVAVIVSTASPIKFTSAMILGLKEKIQGSFEDEIKLLHQKYHLSIDKRIYNYMNTSVNKVLWTKENALTNLKKLVGEIDV
ncbi:MAG: threonine synthase [Candidatus Izemoplasmatales bacterium]